jgi:hypothetical protein
VFCSDPDIRSNDISLHDAMLFADIAKYVDEPLVDVHTAMKHNLHVKTTLLMYEALQYQRRTVRIAHPQEYARAVKYHATEPCSEYFIPKPEFPDMPIARTKMTLFNTKTFDEKMEIIKQVGVLRLKKHYRIALDFLDQCREAFYQTYLGSDEYIQDQWEREYCYDECYDDES